MWKGMMFYRYPFVARMRQEGLEQGREDGLEEGQVKAIASSILKVLDGRGIAVVADTRSRIESCRDADHLDIWLGRATVATEASDLFA